MVRTVNIHALFTFPSISNLSWKPNVEVQRSKSEDYAHVDRFSKVWLSVEFDSHKDLLVVVSAGISLGEGPIPTSIPLLHGGVTIGTCKT